MYFIIAWDLLRIDVYGFSHFCEWFLAKYRGYFVSPIRINGSAVETIFSQYKHMTSGKLDASNYATARASCLTKKSCDMSTHHSGNDYRDCTIQMPTLELSKKKYNKMCKSKEDK